jgi:hypothetical protein
VYALGMMIWETLYYVRHGEVVSVMEKILPGCREGQDVLIAISSGAFTPPCDFLPEPLRRFLRKSWHFKARKRFQDAAAVAREWERLRAAVSGAHLWADADTHSTGSSQLSAQSEDALLGTKGGSTTSGTTHSGERSTGSRFTRSWGEKSEDVEGAKR